VTTLIIPGGAVSSSSISALELGDGQQVGAATEPTQEGLCGNSTTGKIRLERDSPHLMWLLTKHFNLKRQARNRAQISGLGFQIGHQHAGGWKP